MGSSFPEVRQGFQDRYVLGSISILDTDNFLEQEINLNCYIPPWGKTGTQESDQLPLHHKVETERDTPQGD